MLNKPVFTYCLFRMPSAEAVRVGIARVVLAAIALLPIMKLGLGQTLRVLELLVAELVLAGPAGIAILGTMVGMIYVLWCLGAFRKITVLYLRKFGQTQADLGALRLSDKRLSRRLRVVTLDDGYFSPKGVSAISYLPLVALMVMITTVLILINIDLTATQRSFSPFAHGSIGEKEMGQTLYDGIIRARAVGAAWVMVVLLVVHSVRLLLRRRFTVANPGALRNCRAWFASLSKWYRWPALSESRSVVIKSAHPIWEDVVSELLPLCDVVVINLSVSSVHLQWEYDQARRICPDRMVVIQAEAAAQTPEDQIRAIRMRKWRRPAVGLLRARLRGALVYTVAFVMAVISYLVVAINLGIYVPWPPPV